MSSNSPLENKRFYKVKNPNRKFLCALCRAPREMRYSKYLSGKNYLQMIILSVALSCVSFPLFKAKVIFLIFPVWLIWELVNKMLYRKEIPCPYCGFDATWYRRDVNVANQKVKEFWQQNYPDLVNKEDDVVNAEFVANSRQTEHVAESQVEAI